MVYKIQSLGFQLRLSAVEDDFINADIDPNPILTTRALAGTLNIPKSTVHLFNEAWVHFLLCYSITLEPARDQYSFCYMLPKRKNRFQKEWEPEIKNELPTTM